MTRVERIGVSLDRNLLEQFDKLITRRGYSNRSEAIRDLVRECLSAEELSKPSAKAVAAILLVYDHHTTNLTQRLVEMQHHHLVQTVSSVHVHLDHSNCLEIIILQGKVKDIKATAEGMAALKGVKLSRVNIMATGKEIV